jgi:hypothetical protein
MSESTAVEEMHRKPDIHGDGGVQINQRTKVLSNTKCPSCCRKGTIDVDIREYGEYTYCYSCGHREAFIYG